MRNPSINPWFFTILGYAVAAYFLARMILGALSIDAQISRVIH